MNWRINNINIWLDLYKVIFDYGYKVNTEIDNVLLLIKMWKKIVSSFNF